MGVNRQNDGRRGDGEQEKTQLGEMKCDHTSGKNGDGDTCRRAENTIEENQIGTW